MDFNPGELEALDESDRHEVYRAELFAQMIVTEAWREITKIGQAQINERAGMAMMAEHERMAGGAIQMSLEYLKGTIAGIKLMLSMPRISMEQAKAIEQHIIEMREYRDDATRRSIERAYDESV